MKFGLKLSIYIFLGNIFFLLSLAFADKPLAALKDYELTGNEKKCIYVRRIRSTKILDDYQIIFIQNSSKKAYLNKLAKKCRRLKFNGSIAYTTRSGSLCKGDYITAFDTLGSIEGPSCRLGVFYELKSISKERN